MGWWASEVIGWYPLDSMTTRAPAMLKRLGQKRCNNLYFEMKNENIFTVVSKSNFSNNCDLLPAQFKLYFCGDDHRKRIWNLLQPMQWSLETDSKPWFFLKCLLRLDISGSQEHSVHLIFLSPFCPLFNLVREPSCLTLGITLILQLYFSHFGPNFPRAQFAVPTFSWGQICRGPICWGPICQGPICRGPICRSDIFQGPNLPGPNLPGPNLPQKSLGAQFARGPICLEPWYWYG